MSGPCPACRRLCGADERRSVGGHCPGCLLRLAAEEPGPQDDEPPLAAGATFRSLVVEGLLGRGGMGFVYRVHDDGEVFALKILSPELAFRPGFAERFVREARAMAALDHPRIVKVRDFGVEQDLSFILMDYVAGATLRQRLREGRVPRPRALEIALDLCDALAAAHARRIVHRDIKPENILLDAAGRATVTDFGLAKALAGGGTAPLTRASAVMGTFSYRAPEQLARLAVDQRADIFSLGAVLYELLSGEVPRAAASPPGMSGPLARLVRRCLDPLPARRPWSVGQVRRALARPR